ncbi:MAG: hypothetical protein KDC99_05380 [Cyclobacteriaceae bacterium]|nr:hypothetical protein [Cyclobacteriaceae bacterium]
MKKLKLFFVLAALITVVIACNQRALSQNDNTSLYDTEAFKNYWYAGKAEVNAYNLDQSRYGENRDGKAMLIFVTEGFSKSKQVKLDDPEAAGNDKVTVMKLNYTKNFVTGIYPYSMMLSAFTPISRNQFPNTMKVTMTSQEWCGHVFSQMNLQRNKYKVDSYSYFESEGDTHFDSDIVLLEDELFNLIRIDPDHIPMGEVKIMPGLFFTRLKHKNLKPTEATIERKEMESRVIYKVSFPERTLEIQVEKDFPHKILGWQEQFNEGDQIQTTTATLDKTLYIDYWRKNKKEFNVLRDSLGLSRTNY